MKYLKVFYYNFCLDCDSKLQEYGEIVKTCEALGYQKIKSRTTTHVDHIEYLTLTDEVTLRVNMSNQHILFDWFEQENVTRPNGAQIVKGYWVEVVDVIPEDYKHVDNTELVLSEKLDDYKFNNRVERILNDRDIVDFKRYMAMTKRLYNLTERQLEIIDTIVSDHPNLKPVYDYLIDVVSTVTDVGRERFSRWIYEEHVDGFTMGERALNDYVRDALTCISYDQLVFLLPIEDRCTTDREVIFEFRPDEIKYKPSRPRVIIKPKGYGYGPEIQTD